ncbi:MAG: hypothetical protein DRJ33_00510 [Candidatus Methanomethylicota archaeon]|uniref:Uncharacterized protein n=1 Tax=Thermoproteota archaeon TaxID=2056631 RepID=A0A497F1S5_9CREN|nr:MAG: hypothetical protein DRJ33_00510 [Candidatus Verstraetearchaeota archaeon]
MFSVIEMATRDEEIKQMAELLKSGAIMLSQACPVCKTPLFKLPSGDIMCPRCKKRVIITSREEEATVAVRSETVLSNLESLALSKIEELTLAAKSEKNLDQLFTIEKHLSLWLDLLEKLKKLKK